MCAWLVVHQQRRFVERGLVRRGGRRREAGSGRGLYGDGRREAWAPWVGAQGRRGEAGALVVPEGWCVAGVAACHASTMLCRASGMGVELV